MLHVTLDSIEICILIDNFNCIAICLRDGAIKLDWCELKEHSLIKRGEALAFQLSDERDATVKTC